MLKATFHNKDIVVWNTYVQNITSNNVWEKKIEKARQNDRNTLMGEFNNHFQFKSGLVDKV